MNQMMAIITVIAGVLAFWYAILGKAPGFNMDYPKEIKADAEKMLRQFCWIIGPVALASGILELVGYAWAGYISLLTLPVIIVYVILYRKRFKKYLKKMK
jgi:hypothetical protein